ncbi:MAG: TldD/PmbA family protein, partial [Candidatus Hydrogenedentes bacterium]|nr:TldD/PmbA family protein [Candidatus Hydrogenedentota bacterium]
AVGVLVPALKGSAVVKGRSRYADKLGEGIASENITIIDQNDAPKGLNRAPFDGEGVTSKRILLIEDGILRCFLHNLYTARKRGDESTANAGRGGFRGTPEVSASNLYIEPGNETQETLIEGVDEGLFVTGLMGVHTADPISGDFSFGAEGLVIRKGALAESFRGVTIAGNIGGILQGIVSVGSDLRFFGSIGAPSVLISNVMVSGT